MRGEPEQLMARSSIAPTQLRLRKRITPLGVARKRQTNGPVDGRHFSDFAFGPDKTPLLSAEQPRATRVGRIVQLLSTGLNRARYASG